MLPGGKQFDAVGRKAEALGNLVGDGGGNFRAAGGFAVTHFRDDDEFFGAGGFVFQTEGDDAAFANAFDTRCELFDFVRIEIAAAFDDDVFDAAGDIDFALGAVGAVSGIYPGKFAGNLRGTKREEFFGGFGIAVVAGGGGRAAEPQETFGTLGNLCAVFIDDADFVAQQRRT